MIKPEELRIGNYVTVNNTKYRPDITGETVKVVGIENRISKSFPTSSAVIKIEVSVNKYPDEFGQFNEFIDPIPLSEEWLLRLGFTKYDWTDACFIPFNGKHLMIQFYKEEILLYITRITSDSRGHKGSGREYILGKKNRIIYLHQLQNFYYFSTGKELTLKE